MDVSGTIALATALQPVGTAAELHTCISAVILKRARIIQRARILPDEHDDVSYLSTFFDIFLGTAPSDQRRKAIIKFHWHSSVLTHHGHALCIQALAEALAQAICPAPFQLWKRGRWARSTRPLREVTLLSTIGSIGEEVVHTWRSSPKTTAIASMLPL